jgi:uncharacterized protein (DUF362 family)
MQRYPQLLRVKQTLHRQAVADISDAVCNTFSECSVKRTIAPGQQVAIAVGSRGIANLCEIVSAVVGCVRDKGAVPLIVPAMGSHGGATAAGQTRVLASLGITEASLGCPIESSMETVSIGKTSDGFDVRFDEVASRADHIVLVNRVKPHTRLIGSLQSGLIKMMLVGLGNHDGAAAYHAAFAQHQYQFDEMAAEIVNMISRTMPITMGIAIIEDGAEQTSQVEAVAADDFLHREPQLLQIATDQMPSLPFDSADLLIIDRFGKEISGTGMDTNIVGRKWNDNVAAADEWPKINHIYVRRLSEKSAGNATGIGIATYCHQAVVDAMDAEITKTNCITSGHPTCAKIPLVFQNDREALDAVVSQCRATPPHAMKWIAIADTLTLGEFYCSAAYLDEIAAHERLTVLEPLKEIRLDDAGNLVFPR